MSKKDEEIHTKVRSLPYLAQDHWIRLNWVTQPLRELWFWEHWLNHARVLTLLERAHKELHETLLYLYGHKEPFLEEFFQDCYKVYKKQGGRN